MHLSTPINCLPNDLLKGRCKCFSSRQVAELKESYQEKLENTFEMYKDALKDHAYQRALERVEDDYVPLEEFIAEQEKVEVLDTHFR